MKINYTNYPYLKHFENKYKNLPLFFNGVVTVAYPKEVHEEVYNISKVIDEAFMLTKTNIDTSNINYVSKNILNVFDEDYDVADKLWRLRNEVDSVSGVLLSPYKDMYVYRISAPKDKDTIEVLCCVFHEYTFIGFTLIEWERQDLYNQCKIWDNSFHYVSKVNKYYNISYPTQLVVTFELFKNYADVETKIISKAKGRKVKMNGDRYKNDCNVPVTIINSAYFTNIIRTVGFKVKGHFALRACGKGRKNRRLVWINPFEKQGYTRKAKINQNEK